MSVSYVVGGENWLVDINYKRNVGNNGFPCSHNSIDQETKSIGNTIHGLQHMEDV